MPDYASQWWRTHTYTRTREGMHDNYYDELLATLLFLTTFVASALLLLFWFDCAVIAFLSLLSCIHGTVVFASLPILQ